MAKKLANKTTKEIMTDSEIVEKKMNKGDFTPSWFGRLHILNMESLIGSKVKAPHKGEFAIKIR